MNADEARKLIDQIEAMPAYQFHKNMQFIVEEAKAKILNKPKTIKREGWVNVYAGNTCGMSIHANTKEADFWAREHRVACIRIEWEEEV